MQVNEVQSAVEDPVLECITRQERVCHTSYVTRFTTAVSQQCSETYEKKCRIVVTAVETNHTVTRCVQALQRVLHSLSPLLYF